MSPVCPSVYLSVTLRLSIVILRVVYRDKSCTGVFVAGMFLFVPSDTFAVVSFSHKRYRKRVEENANAVTETQTTTPALVCSMLRTAIDRDHT